MTATTGDPMSPEHEREFREFVAARSDSLLRLAYLLTGDVHHAQDLLQTTLLTCARRWHRIERRDQPYTYVRTAMYRHQYNSWRARLRRRESIVEQPPERSGGDDHAARIALRRQLFDDLRTLPSRQRAILVLRYYEDRSIEDVAELLGISPGTVRGQASKALARLRAAHREEATRTGALR